MPRSLAATLTGLTLVALAAPAALPAQAPERASLTGVVVDAATLAPVPGALVELPKLNVRVLTDAQGRFRTQPLRPGSYLVRASQLGYETTEALFALAVGGEQLRLEITPDPVVLEGVGVVADRLRNRRNAVAAAVRAYDRDELATSSYATVMDFVRSQAMLAPAECRERNAMLPCAWVRGTPTPVQVAIDDRPAIGGLDELWFYRPSELYLVEVYAGGRHVRIYTDHYVRWAAKRGGQLLAPVL